ncbi:MAG: chemotaxis protein CheW [Nitrospinae bacterium]|nr:chemotaxis protein CheW [Nitrospinota bacterium]
MDDLIIEFFADCQAHMEGIEEALLRFEKEPASSSGLIDDIFRRAHSVKGNAGVLGVGSIHAEGQKFESFLEGIRQRKRATPEEMDNMFTGLDALRAVIAMEREARMGSGPKEKVGSEPKNHAPPPPPPPSAPQQPKSAPAAAPAPIPQPQPAKEAGPRMETLKPISAAPAQADAKTSGAAAPAMPESSTFLVFDLGDESYGIEIMKVREIILSDSFTPVPNTKPFVLGVMNLRDQIIPIFDLKKRLGIGDGGDERNIIIVEIGKVTTGLKVDEVTGIIAFEKSEITPARAFQGSVPTEFLFGMGNSGKGTIILLNTNDLCHPDELLY